MMARTRLVPGRPGIAPSVLLALLVIFGGCSGVTTVEVEREFPESEALLDRYVIFENDRSLAKRFALERVVQSPDAEPMVVQFDFVNTSKKPYQLWYKTRWLDKDALVVSDATEGWRPQNVLGKERFSIKLVAPSNKAVDYRLILKGES